MTKRLFIAINATDPLEKDFLPFFKKLKINADKQNLIVKWIIPNNFHITMNFLGELPEEILPSLQDVIQEICSQFAPFELKIEDISAFANEHEARVLWLGVQNKKCFAQLKNSMEQALLDKKILDRADPREFSPHLTLGRLRNPHSVKDMISPLKRKSFGKIHVRELVLYESKLQGPFPVYIPLYRYPLNNSLENEKTSTTT
jgi:2'-5' RNA ligase